MPGVVLRYTVYDTIGSGDVGGDQASVTDLVVSGVAIAETFCGAVGTGTCGLAEACADSTLSPPAPTDVIT
jgi:hypothetical protein